VALRSVKPCSRDVDALTAPAPRSVFRRRLHVTAVGAGVYMTRNMVQIVDTTSLALPNYTVPKINIYRFNYIIITCSM